MRFNLMDHFVWVQFPFMVFSKKESPTRSVSKLEVTRVQLHCKVEGHKDNVLLLITRWKCLQVLT